MNLNFEKICRTCLCDENELIFLEENEIQRKLSECCNLQIQLSSNLPKSICKSCVDEIERTYLFREKCLKSDIQLRNLLLEPEKIEVIPDVDSNDADEIIFADACDADQMNFSDGSESESVECEMCLKKFKSKKKLNKHLKNLKCTPIVQSEDEFSCHMCTKKFHRKDMLSRHLKEHFIDVVGNNEVDDIAKEIPRKAMPNELGMFQCQVCSLMLKSRKTLVRHHQTHLGIKFKCKLCDKSYNRKYRVSEHMRDVHHIEPTEDPEVITGNSYKKCEVYDCEKCGKSFRNKYKLRDHLNVVHSDVRPHLCVECGKSYKTKATLQYHESRYHIKIKPFKCEQCPKAYYTNKELVSHIRSHTGEKPFVCSDCGASYSHSDSLNTHRRIHTGVRPFKCEFCPKTFTKGERLKIHRRVHTGERPYACSYCSQRFTQKYDMVKHEKRHPEHQNVTEIEELIKSS